MIFLKENNLTTNENKEILKHLGGINEVKPPHILNSEQVKFFPS